MTPEQQAELQILRQRAVSGELTLDDMRKAIVMLRNGRASAHLASDASRRKKAIVEIPDADQLLKELLG